MRREHFEEQGRLVFQPVHQTHGVQSWSWELNFPFQCHPFLTLSETLVILAILQTTSALVTQTHFLVYCEAVTEQEVKPTKDKMP